jgi:uncharacterized protein YndB with AHSA1/START domain
MDKGKAGKVSKQADGYMVQFERHYPFDIMTVWDAITNPEKISKWFMKVEMELKPGARITIHYGDEQNTLGYGKITAVEKGKLFEYMAASKAIIATEQDHAAEVIQDGHSGLLIETGNVEKFAEAILTLLNDPAERLRLGQNARQQAVELYSWEQYTKRLEEIYFNILGNVSPASSATKSN